MILRKPYAFLIKYFKIIHIIITVLCSFLVYRTLLVYDFLNSYINTLQITKNVGLVSSLFGTRIFIVPIFLLALFITVVILLRVKEKPIFTYIYSIVIYVILFVFLIYSRSVVYEMMNTVVDIRIVKAIRDILLIIIALQVIATFIAFMSATGFNIKKFDFERDLKELGISEEDSEEFELEFTFQSNKFKRRVNKIFRHAKYYYHENKFFINIALALIGVFVLYLITSFINNNRTFSEKTSVNMSGVVVKTNYTYLTSTDYKYTTIDNNYSFVIINVSAKTPISDTLLKTASLMLKIDNYKFYPSNEYDSYMTDLGNSYNDEVLTNEFSSYNLIYKIPNILKNKKMYLNYNTGFKNVKIKLKPRNIDNNKTTLNYTLGESINLENSILKNGVVSLKEFDVAGMFTVNYNFCVKDMDCFNSNEIITPTPSGNYEKTLVRFKGNIAYEDESLLKSKNLFKFISVYGTIVYTKNGEVFNNKVVMKRITSKYDKDYYYMEVDKNLIDSDNIYLIFNVRNVKYIYKIK